MRELYLLIDGWENVNNFIKDELPYLKKNFILTVVGESKPNEEQRNVLEGITLIPYVKNIRIGLYINCVVMFLLSSDGRIELRNIIQSKKEIFNRLADSFKFYVKAQAFYLFLKKKGILHRESTALFYTYWYYEKCFAITNHRDEYPGINIVTRTHGYDLYANRNRNGRQPFKLQMDARLDKVFFAAEYGMNYYMREYGRDKSSRYQTAFLGIKGPKQICKKNETTKFVIVSCSNMILLKRITLIIKALEQIEDANIEWIHFGSGELDAVLHTEAKERLGSKSNIDYRFMGQVDNAEIHNYYENNYVDCFITTTSSEGGNPVSMQEAMSYGIPIIGTAVGDIPRMIEGNGILISETPTVEEIESAIKQLIFLDGEAVKIVRGKSREKWKKYFDASNNYSVFVDELMKI